jgi:hypothetical protein
VIREFPSQYSGGGENETFVSCYSHACHDRILCCTDRFGAIDKDTQDPEGKTAADTNRNRSADTIY